MAVDVSVCVATYRRPEGLARLLASLTRLKRPEDVRLDVWVVDNDPQAGAREAAEAAGAGAGLELHWLHEPRRNIAHARNAAVARAGGRWLAFVDDDEVVHERWLDAHWACVHACGCDGAFGPVLPRLEPGGSTWLDAQTFYARPRSRTGTRVGVRDTRTSNAFLRASLFRGVRFDPGFGRTGGSDVELFGRMLAGGADLRWCDDALVEEWVQRERHRLGWLVQRAFRGGCVSAMLELRQEPGWRARPVRAAAGLVGFSLAAAAGLLAGRRRAARALLRAIVQAGRLYAYAGWRYDEYRG